MPQSSLSSSQLKKTESLCLSKNHVLNFHFSKRLRKWLCNLHTMFADISHLDKQLLLWCCIQTTPKHSGFNRKHLYSCYVLGDIGKTQLGDSAASNCRLAAFDSSLKVWFWCAPNVFVWLNGSYKGHAPFMDYQSTKMRSCHNI